VQTVTEMIQQPASQADKSFIFKLQMSKNTLVLSNRNYEAAHNHSYLYERQQLTKSCAKCCSLNFRTDFSMPWS